MHSSRLVRLAVLLTATAGIARAALLPGPVGIPEFARQVAIDGDTAVVSASAEATELGSYVGAVYVFRRSGDAWVREARLTSIDPAANEYFGSSVAIDGNVIAVGVGRVVTPEVSGSVELFLRVGTTWEWTSRITPNPADATFARVMSMNNGMLAIGLPGSTGAGGAASAGSVQLYPINGGNPGTPQVLYASDGAEQDAFGSSVALEGGRLVVGAPTSDPHGKIAAGSAYLFSVGSFLSFQLAKLTAADGNPGDTFGKAVAIHGDRVLIGAPGQSRGGPMDGAAYVFGSPSGWQQEAKIIVPSDSVFYTAFGSALALGANHAAIGSDYARPYGGQIQVYERVSRSWIRRATLATDRAYDTRFPALALDGLDLVAGFPIYDYLGGAALVYPIAGPAPAQKIKVYTGTDPDLREAPANVTRDFGTIPLLESRSWPVTIFNAGASVLEVTGASLLPGVSEGLSVDPIITIFGNTLFIPPGETAVVTLRTQFNTTGTKSGTLRLVNNDPDEPSYDLPLAFQSLVPPGLRLTRQAGVVVLRYPRYPQFFLLGIERSTDLAGWFPLGYMQQESDVETGGTVMVFRDQNPPPGAAFYRMKVN